MASDKFIDEVNRHVSAIGVLVGAELDTADNASDVGTLRMIIQHCGDIDNLLDVYSGACADAEHDNTVFEKDTIPVPIHGVGVMDFRSGRML